MAALIQNPYTPAPLSSYGGSTFTSSFAAASENLKNEIVFKVLNEVELNRNKQNDLMMIMNCKIIDQVYCNGETLEKMIKQKEEQKFEKHEENDKLMVKIEALIDNKLNNALYSILESFNVKMEKTLSAALDKMINTISSALDGIKKSRNSDNDKINMRLNKIDENAIKIMKLIHKSQDKTFNLNNRLEDSVLDLRSEIYNMDCNLLNNLKKIIMKFDEDQIKKGKLSDQMKDDINKENININYKNDTKYDLDITKIIQKLNSDDPDRYHCVVKMIQNTDNNIKEMDKVIIIDEPNGIGDNVISKLNMNMIELENKIKDGEIVDEQEIEEINLLREKLNNMNKMMKNSDINITEMELKLIMDKDTIIDESNGNSDINTDNDNDDVRVNINKKNNVRDIRDDNRDDNRDDDNNIDKELVENIYNISNHSVDKKGKGKGKGKGKRKRKKKKKKKKVKKKLTRKKMNKKEKVDTKDKIINDDNINIQPKRNISMGSSDSNDDDSDEFDENLLNDKIIDDLLI